MAPSTRHDWRATNVVTASWQPNSPISATSPPAASLSAAPAAAPRAAAVRRPPQLHGPYCSGPPGQRKDRHPTLSETEDKLYQEWISNDRQLRKTITKMRQLAAKASELMITKANKAKV